jgi:hypothetical protein
VDALDPRLENAIRSPRIRLQAGDLVRVALAALDGLRQLDESLYERFVTTRDSPQDPAASASSLRELWNDTFRGLLKLLALSRAFAQAPESTALPETIAEIDFGELANNAAPEDGLELGAGDIGDLLDGLGGLEDPVTAASDEEDAQRRWDEVASKLGTIAYGLRTQYDDATNRMQVALNNRDMNTVLGLLDDAQSSASEGVHALVSAVYEAFAPAVDSATVVPGYLTSLGRALLVRRGVAELSRQLGPPNEVLQAGDTSLYPAALQSVKTHLHDFVSSAVGRAMRPADRWQMVEFDRALETQPIGAARLTSEGLVKYLDSLATINQREVLLIHDRRALEQMRDALATARQLADLSPRTAREMAAQAHEAAMRLRGRHPSTDELLASLGRDPAPETTPLPEVLERLEHVLTTAGG